MSYSRLTWVNGATPARNATNLNHQEAGILEASDRLDDLELRDGVHEVGNSGSALTLDASSSSGSIKTITLTANCTFTFTDTVAGERAQLELILAQDATGSRTVTWPPSVSWAGGTVPTLTGTANTVSRLQFTTYDGGIVWYGALLGTGYSGDEWVWQSSEPFGEWSNGGYIVHNNIWNTAEAGPQTIYAKDYNTWTIVSDQPGTGTDDGVKAYPCTHKLVNITLNSLPTITSTFNVTTPTAGGVVPAVGKQWNATYDLWLNAFNLEVMIWNNWTMNWQYYYNLHSGQVVTVDGIAYNTWNNGAGGTWFVRQPGVVTNVGSVNLTNILNAAVTRGWLLGTDVLNHIEYGFEVSYTGEPTRFALNDFTLTGA